MTVGKNKSEVESHNFLYLKKKCDLSVCPVKRLSSMQGSHVSELQTFKMHALVIDIVIPDLYGLKITDPQAVLL